MWTLWRENKDRRSVNPLRQNKKHNEIILQLLFSYQLQFIVVSLKLPDLFYNPKIPQKLCNPGKEGVL